MSRAAVEIDFFGLEKKNASKLRFRSSIRGIQNDISKINPQLLKTVMASGAAATDRSGARPPEKFVTGQYGQHFPYSNTAASPVAVVDASQRFIPPLPVLNPASRSAIESPPGVATPLTIFYNGTVTIFDLPQARAETIIKMAETGNVWMPVETPTSSFGNRQQELFLDNGDLPLARKKSLQSFLEKREARLTAVGPFTSCSAYEWEGDKSQEEKRKKRKFMERMGSYMGKYWKKGGG